MNRRVAPAVLAAAGAVLAGCSGAGPSTLSVAGPVVVQPVSSGAPAPVYLTIRNDTATDDTLLSVTTAAGDRAVINNSLATGAATAALTVPAHTTTTLDAFDSDILLLNPRTLRTGSTVALTLTFRHAGRVTVDATVETVGQVAQQTTATAGTS